MNFVKKIVTPNSRKIKPQKNTPKTRHTIPTASHKMQEPSKKFLKNKLKSSNSEVDKFNKNYMGSEIKKVKQLHSEVGNLKCKLSSLKLLKISSEI